MTKPTKDISSLLHLVRPNIRRLEAYRSARSEFDLPAEIFLDANENPFDNGVNRYPDPLQRKLKEVLAGYKNQPVERFFLGNGSDEVLDVIVRTFCEPGKDQIIISPPTYGMYGVIASVNDVGIKEVQLREDFTPDVNGILETAGDRTKLLILTSPNNPTGNTIPRETIIQLLENFPGIVVVDEAYIDFCPDKSVVSLLDNYPNLIVTQTLSKAWGMAGLRIGMALAHPVLVEIFNKVKPPYNIGSLAQEKAIELLADRQRFAKNREAIRREREKLTAFLQSLGMVEEVFPSEANFVSARFRNADEVYRELLNHGIVVRNRSRQPLCRNCLRITVGTEKEMRRLRNALSRMDEKFKKSGKFSGKTFDL